MKIDLTYGNKFFNEPRGFILEIVILLIILI